MLLEEFRAKEKEELELEQKAEEEFRKMTAEKEMAESIARMRDRAPSQAEFETEFAKIKSFWMTSYVTKEKYRKAIEAGY